MVEEYYNTTNSKRGKHGRCNVFEKADCGEVVAKENDDILLLFSFLYIFS